ncbi:TetR/AcrR family transcriptional regulator [Phenylobacterium hankyongense]|uniref:TetR/AcrR family transcriptional regulator n=1 Tax=Phenylobacterium hankyongense TaxID=1813876 RepID=A0A328B1B4_9CAUL|nr:TetR/AcrR family transcriptional regulator [Phenylobacterium hankyongense]RAK60689.1 TetR/AcrR family transcriptional regulator [Phenylobacterium hankyongense]
MATRSSQKLTLAPSAARRAPPRQDRAVQTYERLLDVAGELLAEVGVERISTNQICARAGMTPPALYRYFADKYAVLEALGRRLMDRQNAVLFEWLDRHAPGGLVALGAAVEELLRATARVTDAEPGAVWTLRALRAVPQLAHVRIESHRLVTDRMVEVYAPLLPNMPREVLWRRLRLSVELGFAVDEMLNEEDRIPRDDLFRDAAQLLSQSLLL